MKKYLLLALIALVAAACSKVYADPYEKHKVESIRIREGNLDVTVGKYCNLTVKSIPEGTDLPSDLEWLTSNKYVLLIYEGGRVYAQNEGAAIIYVKSKGDPSLIDSITINVSAKPRQFQTTKEKRENTLGRDYSKSNKVSNSSRNIGSQRTTSVQCSGRTKKGYRCSRMTTNSRGRCWQH